jgi:non-specific serine/threonine protein kinase
MSRAMALMNDNLGLVRQLGNRLVMAWVAWRLGYLAVRQGDTGTARALLRESLDFFQEHDQRAGIGSVLAVLAILRHAEGRPAQAARLIGAAEAIFLAHDVRLNLYDRRDYDSQVTLIRERLGEAAFAAHVAEGRELTAEQAVAEALSG